MRTINFVRQLDDSGCGIACLAMVKNSDYYKIKNSLKKLVKFRNGDYGLYKSHILLGLGRKYVGRYYKFIDTKSWTKLEKKNKVLAIVGLNKKLDRTKTPTWHWIVYQKDSRNGGFIFDPQSKKWSGKRKISKKTRIWTYIIIK